MRKSPPWKPTHKRFPAGVVLACLVCALLAAGDRVSAWRGNVSPQFTREPCPVTLPVWMREGVDVICGKVSVPLVHAEPQGKRIRLAVAVVKARSPSPLPEPIVWLEGGPGGHALERLSYLPKFFYANRDLIVFDQRGAGHSVPALECSLPTIPWPHTYLSLSAAYCLDQELRRRGVNLGAYNTHESAQDVIDVVRALGYDRVVLYGGSYGTRLGLTVLALFPDCCRSAVLDGVLPPGPSWTRQEQQLQNVRSALSEVFAACAGDDECARAYPQPDERLRTTRHVLEQVPRRSVWG